MVHPLLHTSADTPRPEGVDPISNLQRTSTASVKSEVMSWMQRTLLKDGIGTDNTESRAQSLVWERLNAEGGILGAALLHSDQFRRGRRCLRDPNLVKLLQDQKVRETRRLEKSTRKDFLASRAAVLDSLQTAEEKEGLLKSLQKERAKQRSSLMRVKERKVRWLKEKVSDCQGHRLCRKHLPSAPTGDESTSSPLQQPEEGGDELDSDTGGEEEGEEQWILNERDEGHSEEEDEVAEAGDASLPLPPLSSSPNDTDTDLAADSPGPPKIETSRDQDPEVAMMETLLALTRTADEDLKIEEEEPIEVIVFGEVQLSECEKDVLRLRPEFAVTERLSLALHEEECEVALTKSRWDRNSADRMKPRDPGFVTNPDEEMLQDRANELTEAAKRLPLDSNEMTLDMGVLRSTDMKNNRRISMPDPRTPKEEAVYSQRKQMWMQRMEEYMKTNCDEKGNVLVKNLTASEQAGLRSLQRRIRDEEIVVVKSDKGKTLTVSSRDLYIRQGEVHLRDHKVIDWTEATKCQRKNTEVSLALVNILKIGSNLGDKNSQKVWSNADGAATGPPNLKVHPKTHKENLPNGDPQTRPVVSASQCPTARPGDILSTVLNAVTNALDETDSKEVLSTEDLLGLLEDAEVKISKESNSVVLGSIDAKALYPSLDVDNSAYLCGQAVAKSKLHFKNIDTRALTIYIAATLSVAEQKKRGIEDYIPLPKSRTKKPTAATPELTRRRHKVPGPVQFEGDPTLFQDPKKVPDEEATKELLGIAIEAMVKVVMKNHIFRFDTKIYKQMKGGAIGSTLTSSVGRIVMDNWGRKMDQRLAEEGIETYLDEKYVDDNNWAVEGKGVGWRYCQEQKKTIWTKEAWEEDKKSGASEDKVMLQMILGIANSIQPDLQFTGLVSEDCPNGKVPMLDFAIWRSRIQGAEVVHHEYYEKPARPSTSSWRDQPCQ